MKLLEITRVLSRVDESIDIHGLQKRFGGNASANAAVKEYRAMIQGRKKELLKPFGLDDLDKFKDDPDGFVKAVNGARDFFAAERKSKALYTKVYENDSCIITMPRGPEGAAAAGSLYKKDGKAVCPWCVAVKYPENKKFWNQYEAKAVFFIYAKDNGVVSNAWCVLLTGECCLETLKGNLEASHVEDVENLGEGDDPDYQRRIYGDIHSETGMDTVALAEAVRGALLPIREKIERERDVLKTLQRFRGMVEKGAFEDATAFLKSNSIDLGMMDESGVTLLHREAYAGDVRACEYLLHAGASVDCRDTHDMTPLMRARTAEVCSLLIGAGADIEARADGGETPLMMALMQANDDPATVLLKRGADVNAVDEHGWTPLIYAATGGSAKMCRLIIDAGADVNWRDEDGSSPLANAAECGFVDVCRCLAEAGANVNEQDGYIGDTPLITAAKDDNLELCRFLLQAGADPGIANNDGHTVLELAKLTRHGEIERLLTDWKPVG